MKPNRRGEKRREREIPEAEAETLREAKGGDLEDIRKRETPASVAQPAPAANKGLRVERSAAERSRVGEFMDLKTDQVISLSLSRGTKGERERERMVGEGERL